MLNALKQSAPYNYVIIKDEQTQVSRVLDGNIGGQKTEHFKNYVRSSTLILFHRRSLRLYMLRMLYTLYTSHVDDCMAYRTSVYFKFYALAVDLEKRNVGRFAL
jgi:hypothetical protein